MLDQVDAEILLLLLRYERNSDLEQFADEVLQRLHGPSGAVAALSEDAGPLLVWLTMRERLVRCAGFRSDPPRRGVSNAQASWKATPAAPGPACVPITGPIVATIVSSAG